MCSLIFFVEKTFLFAKEKKKLSPYNYLLIPYYNLHKIFTAVVKKFARNNVSNKY